MPTTEEHLRLARQFRRFLEEVKPLELPGRQVELGVASCYWSALHYIDAALALAGHHPDSEGVRIRILSQAGGLAKLVRHQRYLKDTYDDLMYRAASITDNDFQDAVWDSYQEVASTVERVLKERGVG